MADRPAQLPSLWAAVSGRRHMCLTSGVAPHPTTPDTGRQLPLPRLPACPPPLFSSFSLFLYVRHIFISHCPCIFHLPLPSQGGVSWTNHNTKCYQSQNCGSNPSWLISSLGDALLLLSTPLSKSRNTPTLSLSGPPLCPGLSQFFSIIQLTSTAYYTIVQYRSRFLCIK